MTLRTILSVIQIGFPFIFFALVYFRVQKIRKGLAQGLSIVREGKTNPNSQAVMVPIAFPPFRAVKAESNPGFGKRVLTGDSIFDRLFLLTSSDPKVHALGFWSSEKKATLRSLFDLGCSSLESNGRQIFLEWPSSSVSNAAHSEIVQKAVVIVSRLNSAPESSLPPIAAIKR